MDAEAARWAARIDASPQEHSRSLDLWLAEDPRRAGALLRAQAILHALGSTQEADQGADIDTEASIARPTRSLLKWLPVGGMAVAASLAVVVLYPRISQPSTIYQTDSGETRQIALADGSAVAIDARSQLEVDYSGTRRTINLREGRAIFRVTKQDDRPFQVVVGDITITDIGTEFQVNDDPKRGRVEVLVIEGEVRIDSPSGRFNLTAGRTVELDRTTVGPVKASGMPLSTNEIARTTAWREGRLELDGDTLAEAVDQLNRGNQVQIVLKDRELAMKELHGAFRMNDPRGFAEAVAIGLGAEFSEQNGTIILER